MVLNDESLNETVQNEEPIYESALKYLAENSGLRRNRPGTSNLVSFRLAEKTLTFSFKSFVELHNFTRILKNQNFSALYFNLPIFLKIRKLFFSVHFLIIS